MNTMLLLPLVAFVVLEAALIMIFIVLYITAGSC
jgi:hypothetical protein